MRTAALVLILMSASSCALREDGVKQCETMIRSRLDSPAFYKRLPDESGDLNVEHPDLEAGYDQRTVDINYETREAGGTPVAHRYECVFDLKAGSVGAMTSAGDRDPRLLDYGRRGAPAI